MPGKKNTKTRTKVWWGKILTMDQLKKRGFSLASRCVFCGKDEESLEHLSRLKSCFLFSLSSWASLMVDVPFF